MEYQFTHSMHGVIARCSMDHEAFARWLNTEITENSIIVTNARHYEALVHANDSILRVIEAMDTGLSGDLISEDLRLKGENIR